MDSQARLLKDAESFSTEIESLDEAGFLTRALVALGISPQPIDATSEDASVAGRIQRPAPAGDSD